MASETIEAALSERHGEMSDASDEMPRTSKLAVYLPPTLRDSVFPPSDGNTVQLLSDTRAVHGAWHRMVDEAEEHLHVLFFAWHDDETGRWFRDLLAQKAGQGLTVRVLCDAMGTRTLPKEFFSAFQAQGGIVTEFLPIRLLTATPVLNFRNHRKLIISDGRRAYTGGVNVTDEYLQWKDIGIILEGTAVNALQEVFVDDWYYATSEDLTSDIYFPRKFAEPAAGDPANAVCETIASGPDQVINAMREMMFLAITRTQSRLWIATPYFVPDEPLLVSLRAAGYRGVDVRLFLPGKSDSPMVRRASRAYYPELLEGGVRIFEYDGMLHAKATLFDDSSVLIGSANLDIRSFRLNFELGILVENKRLNDETATWFATIEGRSSEVRKEDIGKMSYFGQLSDSVAHLLSPLL